MKKPIVKLKLTKTEINVLLAHVEYALECAPVSKVTDRNDKLTIACLTELYTKLHALVNPFASSYNFKISLSHGIAVVNHFLRPSTMLPPTDAILINKIIGIIDMQTGNHG